MLVVQPEGPHGEQPEGPHGEQGAQTGRLQAVLQPPHPNKAAKNPQQASAWAAKEAQPNAAMDTSDNAVILADGNLMEVPFSKRRERIYAVMLRLRTFPLLLPL